MTSLKELQHQQGATTASDGIPLNFGDPQHEYQSALNNVIVLDRSHEARLVLTGKDRLSLMNRMSTNDLLSLAVNEGRPTIFTNPTARILDRVMVYNLPEKALVLGEPARGQPLGQYLQRNIFFGDAVQVSNLGPATNAFDLHGPQADKLIKQLIPDHEDQQGFETEIEDIPVTIARHKPVVASRWTIIVALEQAANLWQILTNAGAIPAGSLTYNILRVRAGLPSVGRELSTEYIPLEVGLWDEISFSKGCYTGQEIIARMESRNRLAKILVKLEMVEFVPAPAELHAEGKIAGQLTSSVQAPDGEIFALAVIKAALAHPGQEFAVGETQQPAKVLVLAGVQPNFINAEN